MGRLCLRFRTLGIVLLVVLCVVAGADTAIGNAIPSREPDWSVDDQVLDVAVSADGSIVAVATEEGLKVYDSQGNLLWNWNQEYAEVSYPHDAPWRLVIVNVDFTAVDVSDDGQIVAAAIANNTHTYERTEEDGGWYWNEIEAVSYFPLLFWKNAKTLSGANPPYNWRSRDLYGRIDAEALAISSDGNQVVAVGTGDSVYYWNNALTLSGGNEECTWEDDLGDEYELEYVDISENGDIIAVLGEKYGNYDAFVYKNCKSRTGLNNDPDLTYNFGTANTAGGIALSDDGLYAVASVGIGGKVCFFNTGMSAPWVPQWTWQLNGDEWAAAVDVSSDGSTVVAVTNSLVASPLTLGIFQNAASQTGNVVPDAEFTSTSGYTGNDYMDVSVDGGGRLAVGGTGDYVFAVDAMTGTPLWLYNGEWPHVSRFVKVSEDGSAVVTAGYMVTETLYYFGLQPVGGVISPIAMSPSGLILTMLIILAMATSAKVLIALRKKHS